MKKLGWFLEAVLVLPVFVGGFVIATRSHAGLIPGGGAVKSDCYAELDVKGITNSSDEVRKNKIVLCTDGAACDVGSCGDNRCNVQASICINQTDPNLMACTAPSALDKVSIVSRGRIKWNVQKPNSLTGARCGDTAGTTIPMKLDKKGRPKGLGKAKVNITAQAPRGIRPRTDRDRVTVKCLPRTVACQPTTTTLPPACGDGVVNGSEECDPNSGSTDCAVGEFCNSTCQCMSAPLCTCGDPEPTSLRFVTEVGTGDCGLVEVNSGISRVLKCGGLYFGGGAESVPLPAPLPDMSVFITKARCNGNTLALSQMTPAETGSERSCTAKDCLFGAPLPIPNLDSPAVSTCIINVIARGAIGTADCQTGNTTIDLPLRSDIYLFADLLNEALPDRPGVPGLQPCPICTKVCSGATQQNTLPCVTDNDCPNGETCGEAAKCLGGTNHGLSCTPATSILGQCDRCPGSPGPGECKLGDQCWLDADCKGEKAPGLPAFCNIPYPTSHDCPLPVKEGQPIGRLPIAFSLTTGTASATAVDMNGPTFDGVSDEVFCGFCRDLDYSYFFGTCQPGSRNAGTPCAGNCDCYVCVGGTQDGQECCRTTSLDACLNAGGTCDKGICGGAIPCQSNADCSQPFEACSQRNNGAFNKLAAKTITLTGSPGGSLVDRLQHPVTLVGTFCIPPIFDPSIDNAADTPGPGATAIPGKTQLLP